MGMAMVAAAAALLMSISGALANCYEDPRRMEIDDTVILLRGLLCSVETGPTEVRLKIELFQFSDIAASLLATRRTSHILGKTIGAPTLIDNEVLKTYRELLNNFGRTDALNNKVSASISASGSSPADLQASEEISGQTIRTLTGYHNTGQYPAANEIRSLKGGTMPPGLNIYYSFACLDEDDSPDKKVCREYVRSSVRRIYWRGVRAADIANYKTSMAAVNAMIRKPGEREKIGPPPLDLRLAMHLAGNNPPEDFVFLVGGKGVLCGDVPEGLENWAFEYVIRRPMMEAMVVQNVSRTPVQIGEIFGEGLFTSALRPDPDQSLPKAENLLRSISATLQPGQKLLIATRITLPAPHQDFDFYFSFPQTAAEIHRRLGNKGPRGASARFSVPAPKGYVFGPGCALMASRRTAPAFNSISHPRTLSISLRPAPTGPAPISYRGRRRKAGSSTARCCIRVMVSRRSIPMSSPSRASARGSSSRSANPR